MKTLFIAIVSAAVVLAFVARYEFNRRQHIVFSVPDANGNSALVRR